MLQEPAVRPGSDAAARAASFDLLSVPIVGQFLKWRHSRKVLQIPLFLLSLLMIGHALFGPQLAPKNLGALLTWVHFRGMVVLVILLAGNLFCMACPFLLPREIARKWFTPQWEFPRFLRNKWPAVVLFVLVLFVYECFDLWSDPWWTGVLIVGYFLTAFVIDVLFRRASFCKYVCPVGQFNFLSATTAPLEVAVREEKVCTACRTKDCIKGTPASSEQENALPVLQRGCELALFQPRKVGNLDCTFCLDCVYACPHDNIGIFSRLPAAELIHRGPRSGLGDIEKRWDFTALAIVFTFGALLNAFAMISPVYALENWIANVTGIRVEWPILASLFAFSLVLEPALLLGLAGWVTRWLSETHEPVMNIIHRYVRSLIPIGFGVWLAHYGFHFFTGFLTVIPVAQNAAQRAVGWDILGEPRWQMGGLPENVVFPMEIGFLALGVLGSWLVAWGIARETTGPKPWAAFLPWACVHLLLFGAAFWMLSQPMDMRGTFLGG